MSGKSKIEWTEATWNPFVGCTHVSAGCDNCYAASLASGRLAHIPTYTGLAEGGKFNGTVRLLPERLDWPLRKTKPLLIFVNSMSDLFHEGVPDEYLIRVFAVMAAASRHTFQVLTKRHGRMQSLLSRSDFRASVWDHWRGLTRGADDTWAWPLRNVWLGVSVENQRWAEVRIPKLLDTPAAVRFLSCEPLLGPVDLAVSSFIGGDWLDGLGWVIVGGESGPKARPMHPQWARALRDQCQAVGVPFLFKQWGEWVEGEHARDLIGDDGVCRLKLGVTWRAPFDDGTRMARVGKKAAGRELDGRTWDEYPEQATADA